MTRWVPQGISQGWTGKSVPLTHVSNAQIKGVINYHKQVTYIEKKNNYSVLNPIEEWLFAPFKILKIIPIHSSYYLILLNFLSSITQLFIINCHYRYIFVSYSFFFFFDTHYPLLVSGSTCLQRSCIVQIEIVIDTPLLNPHWLVFLKLSAQSVNFLFNPYIQ